MMDILDSLAWFDEELFNNAYIAEMKQCPRQKKKDLFATIADMFGPTPPSSPETDTDCSKLVDGATRLRSKCIKVEKVEIFEDFMEEDLTDILESLCCDMDAPVEPQCRCRHPVVKDYLLSSVSDAVIRNTTLKSTCPDLPVLSDCDDCGGLGQDAIPMCVNIRNIFDLPPTPVKVVKVGECCTDRQEVMQEEVVRMDDALNLYLSEDDLDVDVEHWSDSTSDDLLIPEPLHSYPSLPASQGSLYPSSRLQGGSSPSHTVSTSAQVAAMHHNYSQPSPPSSVSSVHSYRRSSGSSTSSRQTLSHRRGSGTQSPANQSRRGGIWSNYPASPVNRRGKYNKKRRLQRVDVLSPPGSDSDGEVNKRAQHNVLERKRRNNLKEFFNQLRNHVPLFHTDTRTSKVVILQGARQHINYLRQNESQLRQERQRLIRSQEELRQRLEALRQARQIDCYV